MRLYTAQRTLNRVNDPAHVFGVLAADTPDVVLLESKDGNGRNNVQSLLFVQNALRLECRGHRVTLEPLTENGQAALEALGPKLAELGDCEKVPSGMVLTMPQEIADGDDAARIRARAPSDVIRVITADWQSDAPTHQRIITPGVFAYDHLDLHEEVPAAARDIHNFPDFVFYLPEVLVSVDHERQTTQLTIFAYARHAPERSAVDQRAEEYEQRLSSLLATENNEAPLGTPSNTPPPAKVDLTDDAYCDLVVRLKKHIECGDVFQIVPSRTFSLPCPNPYGTYQTLRRLNPSPYLFYLHTADFTLLGSSPETSVRVTGSPKTVSIHPIAGTRPRGLRDGVIDHDLDSRLEAELKLNHKEVAEHIMLVDLARNDVARISKPGTRRTVQLMEAERYSHVMHLVSVVQGELKEDLDGLHAYLASSNMGTLVGAPKIEATGLLRRFERDKRGPYGGAVGYFTSDGEMDTAIVIRAALVRNSVAYIRAGAGVVYDSDPQAEADETRAKARAVLRAIELTGEGES